MTGDADLLRKAQRDLESAKLLREAGDCDSAVSRAYYADFYSMSTVIRLISVLADAKPAARKAARTARAAMFDSAPEAVAGAPRSPCASVALETRDSSLGPRGDGLDARSGAQQATRQRTH
jgi:hypothetical protein